MIDRTSTIKLRKEVSVSVIDNEKVMIDFDSGKYFMIKGVGNDIWDMIQTEITVQEIISSLLNEYEIDASTCETQVLSFLQKLEDNNFI